MNTNPGGTDFMKSHRLNSSQFARSVSTVSAIHTQETVGYPTPRGEFPLPTTQEWGEGQGEGKSNKHGPPLPGPLLPLGRRGRGSSPPLRVVYPADSSVILILLLIKTRRARARVRSGARARVGFRVSSRQVSGPNARRKLRAGSPETHDASDIQRHAVREHRPRDSRFGFAVEIRRRYHVRPTTKRIADIQII